MKIAIIIIRVLIGLLLLMGSVVFFLKLFPQPDLKGNMKIFNDGVTASVYLMPLVKAIELLCGISFLTGRFVPLASVIIFPITINVLLVHAFLAPEGLPVALFLFLGNLFIAYNYRKNYEPLFAVK
jgi:putative oxidoreductase